MSTVEFKSWYSFLPRWKVAISSKHGIEFVTVEARTEESAIEAVKSKPHVAACSDCKFYAMQIEKAGKAKVIIPEINVRDYSIKKWSYFYND